MYHPEKVKGKGVFGKIIGETRYVRRNLPYVIKMETAPSEEEMKDINELRDFLDNRKAFNERFKLFRELASDINEIIQKIEIGLDPLEGKCIRCPSIHIKG